MKNECKDSNDKLNYNVQNKIPNVSKWMWY